jgi:hypothetical protein
LNLCWALSPSLLTKWRIKITVQMIELEEVQMMEVSDAAFEEAEVVKGGVYSTSVFGSACHL